MTEEQGLYEIPKSWSWVKLDAISNMITDGSHIPPPKQESGIPMLSAQNIFNDKIMFTDARYISQKDFFKEYRRAPIEQNDVLLTIVGTIGRSTVVKANIPAFAIQRSVALVKTKINPNYLSLYFKSPMLFSYLKKAARGTAQKGIYLNQLREIPVAVAPLSEQLRIVRKVEELFSFLDAGVASLQAVQAQLKRYRQAVLKHAFEGKLTKEFRKKNISKEANVASLNNIVKTSKEFINYNPEILRSFDLPELPQEWIWVPLNFISIAQGGYAFESRKYSTDGYQIVRIGNVKSGKLSLEERPVFIESLREEYKKSLLEKGDVLITLTGTRKKRDYGFVAIVRDEACLLLNQRVGRLRFCNSVVPEFYFYALQTDFFKNQFFDGETGNVGQGNVGMKAIQHSLVPMTAMSEQRKVVQIIEECFSEADYIEKTIKLCILQTQKMYQSVLAKAFKGKLVVQDPNDEPTEKLLACISTELSRYGKTRSGR